MEIEKFSRELITQGVQCGWQDISIMPCLRGYQISYRRGHQREIFKQLSFADGEKVISRFKYLGEMDVGEKRRVQLGGFTYQLGSVKQRLRLSAVGDYRQRESLVIRLLFRLNQQEARYSQENLPIVLKENIDRRGLYLFAGPVGSGKTTLMYSLAKQFDGQVITIEDPVEIEEPSFLQLQINPKIDQTYDVLIQLSLRHHPDILIIGEIRNALTANAAIRAALTGHYVFATLHAKSLSSIKTRMLELSRNQGELLECLQGMIYQEMYLTKEQPVVVCGYQFFKQQQLFLEKTFEMAWRDFIAGQSDEK